MILSRGPECSVMILSRGHFSWTSSDSFSFVAQVEIERIAHFVKADYFFDLLVINNLRYLLIFVLMIQTIMGTKTAETIC
jgi:hypothetical protein